MQTSHDPSSPDPSLPPSRVAAPPVTEPAANGPSARTPSEQSAPAEPTVPNPVSRSDARTEPIPDPAVKRLSLYLRQLEGFRRKERRTISSKQLGESLGLTDAQVRKDLAYFGQFGHPGIGYRVDDLIAHVKRILGTDKVWNVLLVGAGNLGRALMAYKGFNHKGFRLVAVFDADSSKVGKKQGPFTIQSLEELQATVQSQSIRLGMIAVPADHAQGVVDQLVAAGVRGILNFAPVSVTVPSHVALNAVDLSVQLEQLSFQVNFAPAPAPAATPSAENRMTG